MWSKSLEALESTEGPKIPRQLGQDVKYKRKKKNNVTCPGSCRKFDVVVFRMVPVVVATARESPPIVVMTCADGLVTGTRSDVASVRVCATGLAPDTPLHEGRLCVRSVLLSDVPTTEMVTGLQPPRVESSKLS